MTFKTDLFISYAHIDDESLIVNQKGWISEFHRALDIRLAQLLGRRPVIWRDPALQGNHLFDQQILDQFHEVAIMISILTPRYVKSEWCLREVDEFYEKCQQNIGFNINNRARIFKIIKTPVRIEQHPEKIQNVLGYEFYHVDPSTGRIKEYNQAFGQQSEMAYWEKLDDLAHDICAFLESLSEPIAVSTSSQPNALKSTVSQKTKVFLAESSYDTQEFRDSLKRELQDFGYQIFPDKQLPLMAPPLHESVKKYLGESTLSIHLIGENYGVVPEGSQKSIVEIQNEIASAHSATTNISRLIWIPEGCDPHDERQMAFINRLNRGADGIVGADLVQSTLEDFKAVVMDKLRFIKEKEVLSQPATPVDSEAKLIYLICDMQDVEAIAPLEDFLFDQGFEVVIPMFEGDESVIREDHIENLKTCKGAIIFYKDASEFWLRSKMRDFMKINGYGRTSPIALKAIYVAPPESTAKTRLRSLGAEVINGLSGLPEQQLKQLLSKL
ncbi:toll/interleukin-1 receptor domain-containing protein [Olivibacter sitiensis]|uniref:toll/interleukin-1 receptor domain-containing protein n=1 Tax=Olivibacter sitiensis TaxID=376470 RepID=UPI0004274D30|nr:toll/interleukin-1 receptor domain-containing protein [Olivibacter sitiensis]